MSRKELKIAAKQALETWETRWNDISGWDPMETPQGKQDEFVDLAMHSSAEIREALEGLINYMDDIENRHETSAGDLIELREDLASGLRETLNYRNSITAYSREALFEEVGELDALVDVNLLFVDDEVIAENPLENISDD